MPREISIRRRTRLPAEDRRRQIIDVATSIIARRGYWGLSLQDVADSCGLTVNGVLHHVGSKDGLLIAVLEYRDQADVRALEEVLGVSQPEGAWSPEEFTAIVRERRIGLGRLCSALMARNARQPEIVRLYSVLEAESLSPDHPAYEYFTARQRVALEGFAQFSPSGIDAMAFARHVLAAMDGLQLQWLRDSSMDLVSAWDGLAATMDGMSEMSRGDADS